MAEISYSSPYGWVLTPHLCELGDGWKWPASAFSVPQPYFKKGSPRAEAAQPAEQLNASEPNNETVSGPSRKRKRTKKVKDADLSFHHEVNELHDSMREWLVKAHQDLVQASGQFPTPSEKDEHVESVEDLDFIKYQELFNITCSYAFEQAETSPQVIGIDDVNPDIDISNIFNKLISNDTDTCRTLSFLEHTFVVPRRSTMLMSDLLKIEPLSSLNPFDLIVIDPPWPNKSVRRASKYAAIDVYELFRVPLKPLIAMKGYVATWVTNKPKFRTFIRDKLFKEWGLSVVAEWYWLKVTNDGEWVIDLDSPHRKPYEMLIIGQAISTANESAEDELALPETRAMCSVPSAHSRKPFLDAIFQPYIPRSARKLELFARNLLPGWTSWGNEVLRFNDVQYLVNNDRTNTT